MKKIAFSILVLVSTQVFAQHTDQINSNRPGRSQMAFAVGKNVIQTEFGVNYISEDHKNKEYTAKGWFADANLRWGLFKEELELQAEFQYQNDKYSGLDGNYNRSALRQTVLGAKFMFYDPFKNYVEKVNVYSWKANKKFKWRRLIPALAGYAGVNFNLSNNNYFNYAPATTLEAKFSPRAMIIAQNHFGTRWVLVTNLGYNKIGTEFASIDYVLTLTHGLSSNWSIFLENQGYNGKYYSDGILRCGAAMLYGKTMQFDASLSRNIKTSPGLFYAGLGFSWRFDKKYKEVKMAKPGKQSKMDKKMDKAAEKKKRKDNIE